MTTRSRTRLFGLSLAALLSLSACSTPSTNTISAFLIDGLAPPERVIALSRKDTREAFWETKKSNPAASSTQTAKAEKKSVARANTSSPSIDDIIAALIAPEPKALPTPVAAFVTPKKAPPIATPKIQPIASRHAPSVLKAAARAHKDEVIAVTHKGDVVQHVKLLESYQSATGETCRRFAVYAAPDASGTIKTACRSEDDDQWIALKGAMEETVSPLIGSAPLSTAFTLPGEKRDAE